ncbi:protein SCO1/2 [Pseudochelatococcus lubricantis]|uniref:Protein SCO1/2 n=1 Tax=Pseudochelatococcus lubricantis TaxID=1538102 RepID=A0ABX0V956_9HYPH|nr:SCO family protein [Pseudochelatococcus lubricantis]NIJ59691.1 protein SCO1/2 [Pseudochelatococcus lubricantis]
MPKLSPIPAFVRIAFACLIVAAAVNFRAYAVEPIGGAFSLTAHTGKRISDKDLLGRPYAVFFGFTHCPDICPTALFDLSRILEELGPDGDRITPLFVTVDPARDTLEVLGDYVSSFDPRIVALRGSDEETAAVARAFRATYRKVELGDGEYNVDHTAVVYLMDRNGHFFDTVDYRTPLDQQTARFRAVIGAR